MFTTVYKYKMLRNGHQWKYRLHMKRLTFHIAQISGKTAPTVKIGFVYTNVHTSVETIIDWQSHWFFSTLYSTAVIDSLPVCTYRKENKTHKVNNYNEYIFIIE